MEIQANCFGISERLNELRKNLSELELAKEQRKHKVKLTKAAFITPLSILPLAVYANNNGIQIECLEKDGNVCSYLDTIGFQDGLTNLPETIKGYLPITRLPPVEDNLILGQYEDGIISQVPQTPDTKGFKTSLKYLTSELVNNVNEHSQTDEYWLLAQYYSQRQTCEIVLADCGIGYKASYRGTKFEVKTDMAAIENALEGRSSKSARAKTPERGKGIPSIVNMFVNGYGGKIIIASGNSIAYYNPKENQKNALGSYWQGTLVGINFKLKAINPMLYVDV